MRLDHALERAMAVPGTCVPREVAWLYRAAYAAPTGTQWVELGTYLGRTLIALAAAAQERKAWVVSIDDYSYHEPCTIEQVRRNLTAAGLASCDAAPKVTLVQGNSRDVPALIGKVGLLFVDSHHVREHFDAEMKAWLHRVVPGGIVACHDYGSARWPEITGGVKAWLDNPCYERMGLVRRLIVYRRLA